MQCAWEPMETKFGEPCNKGHTFCMEDRCPDYTPVKGSENQDA